MPRLRDGSSVRNPLLGRLERWDHRNEAYMVAPRLEAAAGKQRRGRTYQRGERRYQQRGTCVAFGLTVERGCEPVPVEETDETALALFHRAQELDPFEGFDLDGGTTVVAGCEAARERGWFDRYEWCRNVDELVDVFTLPVAERGERFGPVVVGLDWHSSMWETDDEGWMEVRGQLEGGHLVCIRGCQLKAKHHGKAVDEPVFRIPNTWRGWGVDGEGFITASGLERALGTVGRPEIAVPIRRGRKRG